MKLGLYYIDVANVLGEDFSGYQKDEEGVPFKWSRAERRRIYNPVTVCHYGLYWFNRYLTRGLEKDRRLLLQQAEWLLNNGSSGPKKSLLFYYSFDVPEYTLKAPWVSGMAQGEALSLFLRAYEISGRSIFLESCHRVFNSLMIPVDEGGPLARFPDGTPIIEEYPSPIGLIGVLNGSIYGILGIYDYLIYTKNRRVNRIFKDLIEGLKRNLSNYDCCFWSFYDIKNPQRLSSVNYHRLHVEMMRVLYKITGEETFYLYHERWKSQLASPHCRLRWLAGKGIEKLKTAINTAK